MAKRQQADTKVRRKPENVANPFDMDAKRKLHPQADDINFIDDRGMLVCGAHKKKGVGHCRSTAGAGTDHRGYGRCRFCGGKSTGPKTAEGKARTAQNARKHGFYSKVLLPDEQETYEQLLETRDFGLEHEISVSKAKILTYLNRWKAVYDAAYEEFEQKTPDIHAEDYRGPRTAEEAGYRAIRCYYTTGIEQERAYYHAGTADDKVLTRQLDLLRRLVDSQSKLNPTNTGGLLDDINKELRAASQGRVTMEWGARKAQSRQDEKPDQDMGNPDQA